MEDTFDNCKGLGHTGFLVLSCNRWADFLSNLVFCPFILILGLEVYGEPFSQSIFNFNVFLDISFTAPGTTFKVCCRDYSAS